VYEIRFNCFFDRVSFFSRELCGDKRGSERESETNDQKRVRGKGGSVKESSEKVTRERRRLGRKKEK